MRPYSFDGNDLPKGMHPCRFNYEGVCVKKCPSRSDRKCRTPSAIFLTCLDARRRSTQYDQVKDFSEVDFNNPDGVKGAA